MAETWVATAFRTCASLGLKAFSRSLATPSRPMSSSFQRMGALMPDFRPAIRIISCCAGVKRGDCLIPWTICGR